MKCPLCCEKINNRAKICKHCKQAIPKKAQKQFSAWWLVFGFFVIPGILPLFTGGVAPVDPTPTRQPVATNEAVAQKKTENRSTAAASTTNATAKQRTNKPTAAAARAYARTFYVTANSLNVRNGSGGEYNKVGKLSHGARVGVFKRAGDWARVSVTGDTEQWVHAKYLSKTKPAASDGSINRKAYAACDNWVDTRTSYSTYKIFERAREYEIDGSYHLQANISFVDIFGKSGTGGFDCTVITRDGYRVVGFMKLKQFRVEKKIKNTGSSLTMRRLQYAGSACPTVGPWKTGRDRLMKGDYKWNLPPECIVLSAGTRTYGFMDQVEYRSSEFVKVRLDNGKEYWIEPVNF